MVAVSPAETMRSPLALAPPLADDEPVVLLTIVEVAAALRVSKSTVKRLIARGELPVVRFGRSVRISVSELEGFVARSRGAEPMRSRTARLAGRHGIREGRGW
jgi:excisionase family DNA binding protein